MRANISKTNVVRHHVVVTPIGDCAPKSTVLSTVHWLLFPFLFLLPSLPLRPVLFISLPLHNILLASSLTSAMASSTACPSCGVDVHKAFEQMETARRKLELWQEKLDVDQELLAQDKKNFKRRARAAKARTAAAHQQAEQSIAEAKEERDEARHNCRQATLQAEQAKEKLSQLEKEFEEETMSLKDRIRSLEALQKAKEQDREELTEDWQDQQQQHQDIVGQLRKELARQQDAVTRYEMQLLDLERDNDEAVCMRCPTLERELEDSQEKAQQLQRDLDQSKTKLTDIRSTKVQLELQVEDMVSAKASLESKLVDLEKERAEVHERLLEHEQLATATAKKIDSLQDQIQKLLTQTPAFAPETQIPPPEVGSTRLVLEKELTSAEGLEGIYTGTVNDKDLPHGSGTLRVDDGAVYDGDWLNGKRHGRGVWATVEGDIYNGSWKSGVYHGYGVFCWSDGRVYRGEYVLGNREGGGVMVCTLLGEDLFLFTCISYVNRHGHMVLTTKDCILW